MGFFNNDDDAAQYQGQYDQYQSANKAEVSHELISGAAAYEAAKAWEKHSEANGAPPSHAQAKELLAGVIGAFVDREVETKGMDYIDKEKAKRQAQQQAEEQLQSNY